MHSRATLCTATIAIIAISAVWLMGLLTRKVKCSLMGVRFRTSPTFRQRANLFHHRLGRCSPP